jgi:hypothetical protein
MHGNGRCRLPPGPRKQAAGARRSARERPER